MGINAMVQPRLGGKAGAPVLRRRSQQRILAAYGSCMQGFRQVFDFISQPLRYCTLFNYQARSLWQVHKMFIRNVLGEMTQTSRM
jgi:hypothetical protein